MKEGRSILALFTRARRQHMGLSQAQLARSLGLRRDQISKAECGLACGTHGRAKLLQFNELERDGHAGD